jgi:hypothetical protein
VTRILLSLIAASVLMAGADSKPDFSGMWVLDKEASDFGGPVPDLKFEIRHRDPEFLMTQITAEERRTFRMTTDGKECTNPFMDTEMKTRMWWDGADLRVESTVGSIVMKDLLTLSADKRTLTAARQMISPDGERQIKIVLRQEAK